MNRNRKSITEEIIRLLYRHPYLCAFIICISLNPLFFGATENIPGNVPWICALIVFSAVSKIFVNKYRAKEINRICFTVLEICSLAAILGFLHLYSCSEYKGIWFFTGGCLAVYYLYWRLYTEKYDFQMKSLLIMGIGFMLKLLYVLETSVYVRQHDVGSFDGDIGHAGYIEYLLQNFHLPDFDVRERWQFCHPPLHHIISAAWVYINEKCFMVDYNQARESIQTLTLFYSMCIVISAYKIFRYFKLEGKSLYLPLAVVAFHPSFIIFSASINNDVLAAAFMMGTIVSVLNWYRNPDMKNIIKTALCLGLGMMTKLTAALAAPPVAAVFIITFIKNMKKDWKKFLIQFAVFGIICVPLGLWFEIRNFIKWDVPVLYVQEMSKGELQYIGDINFFSRISDFSLFQFRNVFEQWAYTDDKTGEIFGYNEYNPLIALLKTSVFGEFINSGNSGGNEFLIKMSEILFYSTALIAAGSFILMIIVLSKKGIIRVTEKILFASFYLIMMINYYKLQYDYPFVCTMDFRYITPSVITGALFYGIAEKHYGSGSHPAVRAAKTAGKILAVNFVICTMVVYIGVCSA